MAEGDEREFSWGTGGRARCRLVPRGELLLDRLTAVKLFDRLLQVLLIEVILEVSVEGSGAEVIAEKTGCCRRRRAVGLCSGTRLKQESRNCFTGGLIDLV